MTGFATTQSTMPVSRLLTFLLLLSMLFPALSDPLPLDTDHRDWRQLGEQAREQQLPIAILVTDPDCGYCERLKKDVLIPMARDGRLKSLALLRELSMDAGGKLVDFDGERIRWRIFIARYQVFAAPTLLIVDADGVPLHDPIIGYNGPDAYRDRLIQALSDGVSEMRGMQASSSNVNP